MAFSYVGGAQVEPGERPARVRIRFADRIRNGLFEMQDGARQVRIGRALLTRAEVDLRRGDQPEHAMRFRIGRRNLQRLLRRADRFVEAIVPQVQRRQFSRDVGRQRIELHRLLVRRDRARHVVLLLEMMADEELLVRLSHLRGRGGRRLRRARARGLRGRHRGNQRGTRRSRRRQSSYS